MRILFAFVGGNGHFQPLIPIARIAGAAGHIVAFTGRPGMMPTVSGAGFTGFASGVDHGDTDKRFPLTQFSAEQEDRVLREGFAYSTARSRATDILSLCGKWQPDLIVCDELDFGAMIAAEQLGLVYATVLVIASGAFVRKEVVAEALNDVRAEHGLSPDPALVMLSRYLVLSPFPPSFRHPNFLLPSTAHVIHPLIADPVAHSSIPAWLPYLPDLPTIYFTLGTIFNRESGDLFSRVLMALRDLPFTLIVTVGPHIKPEEFGRQPDNVYIEQYTPQSLILPHCDMVISHGGSGSVIGSLVYGLPSVLIPMGADQPLNAARCENLGVARVLDPIAATSEMIREAVTTVIESPGYRQAAERLRDEIATLPGPEYALILLQRLAVTRQPFSS